MKAEVKIECDGRVVKAKGPRAMSERIGGGR